MSSVRRRGLRALNLNQYNQLNKPESLGQIDLALPYHRMYVLRCLIKRTFEDLQIPPFLRWCRPMIEQAFAYQEKLGINQPFCYITVRHGIVDSVTDDEWHVDGFSMNVTHLPEQNYIWTDHTPTEYVVKKIKFPADFNPRVHNIHGFFQDHITNDDVKVMKPMTTYCMDPYVIHRRPTGTSGKQRTFIRISFTQIEIADKNNTLNPLLETNYTRDGIGAFRNKLIKYIGIQN